MISALSAKQLYDFVPLSDSYLALSHMHNCNEYFCPVYLYILYFIYIFATILEMYLPRNAIQKVHGKKPNNFVKLLNELSINPFLQYFGAGGKGRGARREILLAFSRSVAQLQTVKRNMVCWQKEKVHVFLQLGTILCRIISLRIHNKQWAFSNIFRTQ